MFFSSITADYTKMGYPKAIVRALDFLKNADLKALPGGRHAIEGDMMYANVDDVETKLFEAGILPLAKYPIKGVIWYQGDRRHALAAWR